jgi:hypothetical protein
MTLEFSASLANLIESVSISGFNVILTLALLLTGCAKKPVQAPRDVAGKVVNPSCVKFLIQRSRSALRWRVARINENEQLFCSGKIRANLACIPAK